MAANITIKATVRDSFFNTLRHANRFFSSYGRKIAIEARQHAKAEAVHASMYIYSAYTPRWHIRTYQLFEGMNADVGGRWPRILVSVYNTAVNRDPKNGDVGFPYPNVVEFGQGAGARDPDEVGARVVEAMNGSEKAVGVMFGGRYGWHTMPPRPAMTIAVVAAGNWFYKRGAGQLIRAWFEQPGQTKTKVVRIIGGR